MDTIQSHGTKVHTTSIDIDGKEIRIKTGRMAKQAHGACEVYCGDTMVLVTATEGKQPRDGVDFFPLLVDYEEKLYAVGRVPGSFGRREGKAPDKAILISRLIDRPIRPLFPYEYRKDVQIVATAMSADQENPTDVLAMLGASIAIGLGGLPFNGPIGAVRVGRINGKFVANPTFAEMDTSDIDLVVAGTENSIMMVEAGCKLVTETDILNAIDYAHKQIKRQVEMQRNFFNSLGIEKHAYEAPAKNEDLKRIIHEKATQKLKESMDGVTVKQVRTVLVDAATKAVQEAIAELPEDHPARKMSNKEVAAYIEDYEAELMRAQVLETGRRADGRKCHEIRPLDIEVGILPRTHGTGLFQRGNHTSSLDCHTRYRQRCSAARLHRSANRKALHAPLQFPRLLSR